MVKKIREITAAEIKEASNSLHYDITDKEVDEFRQFMQGMIADVELVEATKEPKLEVKYPREHIHKPNSNDNPFNAWSWKCNINGNDSGKLLGKKIVIKDNIGIAEVPMQNGSAVFEGLIPDQDATVVTRVLDAGAKIIGKAVCENYCFSGGSHTAASGPVTNPHNQDYMAGGSSSGCAALLVGGYCDMAIGSDQGGSVRMPASFSGCFGLKPTYGLVPYTGASGIEQSVDHLGPMAMSAHDCAILLEVLSGFDQGRDPRQSAFTKEIKYSEEVSKGVNNLKIGLVKEGFNMRGYETDVSAIVKKAAFELEKAGCNVEEISVPMHKEAGNIMLIGILDGTLSTFTEQGPNGPNFRGHSITTAIDFYYQAQRNRANLMPITVKNFLMFAKIMRNRYGNYYSAKAQNIVQEIRQTYNQAFQKYDLLVMPTTPMKAHKIPPPDASNAEVLGCALDMLGNTAPFDATGHPSLSMPAGKSEGLPVGLMITGREYEDDVVLRCAHELENILKKENN